MLPIIFALSHLPAPQLPAPQLPVPQLVPHPPSGPQQPPVTGPSGTITPQVAPPEFITVNGKPWNQWYPAINTLPVSGPGHGGVSNNGHPLPTASPAVSRVTVPGVAKPGLVPTGHDSGALEPSAAPKGPRLNWWGKLVHWLGLG